MKHKTILTLVLMVSGLFFLNSSLFGAEQFFKGKPTLPGKPYGVLLLSEWSKQEKWVWKQICEGKQANLAEYSGGAEDPKTKKGWKKNQKLSSKFLETILLYEPYISSLTHKGIHISGAWFVEMIDLQNANINYEIRIEFSRFDETVDLFAVKTSSLISFNNSSFYKNPTRINRN